MIPEEFAKLHRDGFISSKAIAVSNLVRFVSDYFDYPVKTKIVMGPDGKITISAWVYCRSDKTDEVINDIDKDLLDDDNTLIPRVCKYPDGPGGCVYVRFSVSKIIDEIYPDLGKHSDYLCMQDYKCFVQAVRINHKEE